jgi:predicted amidohydrolase
MFKTAIIQFAPVLGDIEKNTDFVDEQLEGLSEADVVLLPELASTGYNFRDTNMANSLAERPTTSNYVDMLQASARTNNQFIITGFNEKSEDCIYNSSLLIGPAGLLGTYRKMHLFMNEKNIFRPGDGKLEVFDTGFCKLGMQICFDYLFPEPWRILAEKKAEVIVHPSNLLTQNAMKALPGIALMNRIYIITANRIGTEGDLTFNGSSMVMDPSGNIVVKGSPDITEVIQYEIDPTRSHDKMITTMNHVFDDRRPEQYTGDNC